MKTSSRHRSIVAYLVLLLLILLAPGGTAYGNTREVRGSGDFEFFFDSATFMDPDGSSRMEMYFRISNSEIRFKEVDNAWRAKVEVEIELLNEDGEGIALREKREFEFTEGKKETAASTLQFQTVILKVKTDPGKYVINCRLKDMNSPKLTILGLARKEYKNAKIMRAPLAVATYPPGTTSLSDPKYVWEISRKGAKTIYHPNPTRMYGLYRDSLLVYYELYVPREEASEDLLFENVILDGKGEIVKESEKMIRRSVELGDDMAAEVGGMNVLEILITEDLTTLPAGTYTLYTQVGSSGVPLHRSRSGSFTVAWEMRSWESSARNLLVEARFLMEDEEFELFKTKSRAEQENALKAAWKALDPNPATGVNEAYEAFMERLAYVNAHYSDYGLGAHTDRGMIYLKYGKPDDTIIDVIPINRESTTDAVEKIRDKYHSIIFSSHGGRISYANPKHDIVTDRRGMGRIGEGNDAYPFEVWIYNQKGKPILEKHSTMSADIGMRFIFIDREGFGRYTLEASSSVLDER